MKNLNVLTNIMDNINCKVVVVSTIVLRIGRLIIHTEYVVPLFESLNQLLYLSKVSIFARQKGYGADESKAIIVQTFISMSNSKENVIELQKNSTWNV